MSINEIYHKKINTVKFSDEWRDFIGDPELCGSWFIWGNSGNGKTVFALQLAKYLTTTAKVAFDSLEEGISESLTRTLKIIKMEEARKIMFLDKETIDDLIVRLDKKKSPNVIIIDSLQYSGINIKSYKKLLNRFGKKLFIIVSHADGKQPAGRIAKSIRYDANVKIWVEGFKAFPQSRYGGGEIYTIWQEGADRHWGGI